MTAHDPTAYGDAWATIYDDWHPTPPEGAIDFLSDETNNAAAARHLEPGGRFVIECFVPDLSRFTDDANLSTRDIGDGVLRLDASVHDPITQIVRSQHVFLRPSGTELLPVDIRYSWPPELDLMGRLAGLTLRTRHGGWHRQPFERWSTGHVSVYERG